MALRSGFFNSINGDRVYHTGHWAEYFASFIGNGVFPNPSNNLQVASNNNMTITIKPGKAWINGYILINDSDYQLSLTPADGVLNRIDRIVARYDTVARAITLEVKQGTFASSPVAPALQRNADGYELALADVRINAGVISITQANITDTRLNSDLCGIVHGVVEQVDTTAVFNQYQAWFNDMKDGAEQEVTDWQQQQYDDFMIWFQSIQDILEGDVAANLASRISSLENDFTSHQAESATQAHMAKNIGLEDTGGNFVATNVEGAMSELFTNVSDGKNLVGGAITGVDDSVVIPTDPTFGDLASAIGHISTFPDYLAGNSLTLFNDTSTYTGLGTTTYSKTYSVKNLKGKGTIRLKFDFSGAIYAENSYARVYINDVPVGLERAAKSTPTLTFVEDFNIKEGDIIQIYTKSDGTPNYYPSIRGVSIYADFNLVLFEKV